jgi:hypothetical protein
MRQYLHKKPLRYSTAAISFSFAFLLSEAQPKNALVNPPPQIWKEMQTLKKELTHIREILYF